MFVVFSGLDISFTVSVILISMIIVAYIFSMKRKKERSRSQDGAKKDYKVEKWLKVVCAAKGLSAGEWTSFLSCNVPSSLDAAHNDELSLLKGVETVRVRLPGRGERERDAKSSYSGEVRNSCFCFF